MDGRISRLCVLTSRTVWSKTASPFCKPSTVDDVEVSMAKIFEKIFRESLVIELAWEEIIEYKTDNQIRQENFKRISFMELIKKYFNKKIRSIFK